MAEDIKDEVEIHARTLLNTQALYSYIDELNIMCIRSWDSALTFDHLSSQEKVAKNISEYLVYIQGVH